METYACVHLSLTVEIVVCAQVVVMIMISSQRSLRSFTCKSQERNRQSKRDIVCSCTQTLYCACVEFHADKSGSDELTEGAQLLHYCHSTGIDHFTTQTSSLTFSNMSTPCPMYFVHAATRRATAFEVVVRVLSLLRDACCGLHATRLWISSENQFCHTPVVPFLRILFTK